MLERPYSLEPKWMRRHTHTRLVGVVRKCCQRPDGLHRPPVAFGALLRPDQRSSRQSALLARRSQAADPAVRIGTCDFKGIGRSRCRAGLPPATVGLGSLRWMERPRRPQASLRGRHTTILQALPESPFLICSPGVRYKACKSATTLHRRRWPRAGVGERVTGLKANVNVTWKRREISPWMR
jgi:hypothetical protein